jgi:OPT oligopeptide transporter protein
MFIYEIFPSYIFPLLNGLNIFCLASQHASPAVQDVFTNVFGGSDANEGLGLFSLSFDWQYLGSGYVSHDYDLGKYTHCVKRCMSLPLILQANAWIGYLFSYIVIAAIYYSNTWNESMILLACRHQLIFFLTVKVLSHALDSALLFQWFYIPPKGCFHGTQFPIESDCA